MEKQTESIKQDNKNNLNARAQKKSKFQIKFSKKIIAKIAIAVVVIVIVGIHVQVLLRKIENYNFTGNKNLVSTINPSQNIEATSKPEVSKEPEVDKKLDSDEDGIPDYLENIIGTNLKKADSDGDNYSDLKELKGGYDPMNIENPSKKLTEEELANLTEKIKAADEEFYNKEFRVVDSLLEQFYANSEKGFKIRPPKNWKIDESGRFGTTVLFINPNIDMEDKNSFNTNINIMTGYADNLDMDAFIRLQRSTESNFIQNYKEISNKIIRINDNDAHLIDGTYTMGVFKLRGLQLAVIHNGIAYSVTSAALESMWGKYKDLIEVSLLTFEITK